MESALCLLTFLLVAKFVMDRSDTTLYGNLAKNPPRAVEYMAAQSSVGLRSSHFLKILHNLYVVKCRSYNNICVGRLSMT